MKGKKKEPKTTRIEICKLIQVAPLSSERRIRRRNSLPIQGYGSPFETPRQNSSSLRSLNFQSKRHYSQNTRQGAARWQMDLNSILLLVVVGVVVVDFADRRSLNSQSQQKFVSKIQEQLQNYTKGIDERLGKLCYKSNINKKDLDHSFNRTLNKVNQSIQTLNSDINTNLTNFSKILDVNFTKIIQKIDQISPEVLSQGTTILQYLKTIHQQLLSNTLKPAYSLEQKPMSG